MASTQPVERHFSYLLSQETEERDERRGLEQRAGGLIAALLVAFPLVATVAISASLSDGVQAAGLIVLGAVLIGALIQAAVVTAALGAPRREEPNIIKDAREQVKTALAADCLEDAVAAQTVIVTTLRTDNGTVVRTVRTATAWLPVTLLGVLVGLSLIVGGAASPNAGKQGPVGPRGQRGPAGHVGPPGPRGAHGARGSAAP
jgi:hypothetical protein